MAGQWQGHWQGAWDGSTGAPYSPVALAALRAAGTGAANISAQLLASQQPENGPSGGANWARGYRPTHDYAPQRRRNRRDELLFLRA